jgi:hypothetical protein
MCDVVYRPRDQFRLAVTHELAHRGVDAGNRPLSGSTSTLPTRLTSNIARRPYRGMSVLSEVRPPTGEPDAGKSACPVRKEGVSKPIDAPYPYQQKFDSSVAPQAPSTRPRTQAIKHIDVPP